MGWIYHFAFTLFLEIENYKPNNQSTKIIQQFQFGCSLKQLSCRTGWICNHVYVIFKTGLYCSSQFSIDKAMSQMVLKIQKNKNTCILFHILTSQDQNYATDLPHWKRTIKCVFTALRSLLQSCYFVIRPCLIYLSTMGFSLTDLSVRIPSQPALFSYEWLEF